jgi:hypothetical protein
MATVSLTPQLLVRSGLAATYTTLTSTTDTYVVSNDGKVMLHFKKTGAGVCTVTIQSTATIDGLPVEDQTVTVPATVGDVMTGYHSRSTFNDAAGRLGFTVDNTAGLSVAIIQLP